MGADRRRALTELNFRNQHFNRPEIMEGALKQMSFDKRKCEELGYGTQKISRRNLKNNSPHLVIWKLDFNSATHLLLSF